MSRWMHGNERSSAPGTLLIWPWTSAPDKFASACTLARASSFPLRVPRYKHGNPSHHSKARFVLERMYYACVVFGNELSSTNKTCRCFICCLLDFRNLASCGMTVLDLLMLHVCIGHIASILALCLHSVLGYLQVIR